MPINQSGWAIASGYLGLLSFFMPPLLGPLAIITGLLAIRECRRKPGLGGTVRAAIGIVLGALTILLFAFGVIMIIISEM